LPGKDHAEKTTAESLIWRDLADHTQGRRAADLATRGRYEVASEVLAVTTSAADP
jgi:hypothetical protein